MSHKRHNTNTSGSAATPHTPSPNDIRKAEDLAAKLNELDNREGWACLYNPVLSVFNADQDHLANAIYESSASFGRGSNDVLPGVGPVAAKGAEVFSQAGQEVQLPCGGLGFMPWGGSRNRMPMDIVNTAKSQPYSASALRYLTELAVGLGPRIIYKYASVVGGFVKEFKVPFEHGEFIIRQRLQEATDPKDKKYWEGQLDKFHACLAELREFLLSNNLYDHYRECMEDSILTDMFYVRYGLTREYTQSNPTDPSVQGGKPMASTLRTWLPKIVTIDYIPVTCGRLEKRDERCNINHVYYSESWRQTRQTFQDKCANESDAVMYPMLGAQRTTATGSRTPYRQLQEYISKVNSDPSASKTNINDWVALLDQYTWFAQPVRYGSNERAYYTQPYWWSIYTSLVFMYLSTFIYDKAVARKNGTMPRYILYIKLDYFDRLRAQAGIKEGDKDQIKEFRSKLIANIENFIGNRSNNGKMLILDEWFDGKDFQKSVEIVKIPEPETKSVSIEELGSISSIVAWAFGIHSALLGDHPGNAKSSSGGTFQRELHLLKQNQMAARQQQYIDILRFIRDHNGWIPEMDFEIEMPILTTLDNSKTGIVTTSTI